MKKLFPNLKNPLNKYRPAPLWVWNDEMDKGEIEWQLKQLASHGFGGAFVHPRPGLITPYLSKEWFDLWGYALQVAKELGIYLYIYDENSYPSGFGGGHVSAQHEDKLSTFMRYKVVDKVEEIPEEVLAVYAVDEVEGSLKNAFRLDGFPKEDWAKYGEKYIVIYFQDALRTGWMAGFGYVDLLRPEVTQTFLECTHEAYYSRFGKDFGKTIPAIFTDEPSVGMYGDGGMPYSLWFLEEFEKRNGYSLEKHLPLVFDDVEGECFDLPAKKVRFDYFDTIARLWTNNAIKPIGKWCEKHGIHYTGHYMEHLWPLLTEATSPAVQSNYEYHSWPAVDMLLSSYLKEEPTHAITHTLREVASAANQFGKERVVCELYGAGGWDSTFDDYKRMADWVIVNGVNFVNQHLTYSTIAGARKHDHPQSFDWREPWWEEYTSFNDYIARACYLLSQGKAKKNVLVLNPTLTGYITSPEKCDGNMFKYGGMDAIKNPDMSGFLTLCQRLTDYGYEYDLGDEYTLERHAKVTAKGLKVGEQTYDIVLISGDMKVMLSSTLLLMENCLKKGVVVAGVGFEDALVDGQEEDRVKALKDSLSFNDSDFEGLHKYLCGVNPPEMDSLKAFPSGVTFLRRELGGGKKLYFFTNQSMGTWEDWLRFKGGSVKEISLFEGEIVDVPYERRLGTITMPVCLRRNQSLMLLVSDKKADGSLDSWVDTREGKKMELRLQEVWAEKENLYPIIYADYGDEKSLYVKRLCDKIFAERGFDGDPWDNKVQYKRSILDKNNFGEDSGFCIDYHFTLEEDFTPEKLSAVAERPELCRMEVNGKKVVWTGETFLDRHFGVADITPFVKSGENIITIVAEKFDVRLEVDAVYIKGDFSVFNKEGKWVIGKPITLKNGSWKTQGYPFYPFAVTYTYAFALDKKSAWAEFDLSKVKASALSLVVNGKDAGLLGVDGKSSKEISAYLQEGENTLCVRVCGSHKNFLGPHFDKTRGSAWPAMWKASPERQPIADEYDLLDYGVFGEPVLTVKE